jgi:hypothetical protein
MTMQSIRTSQNRIGTQSGLRFRLLQTTLITAAAFGLAAFINSAADAADIVTHAATDASVVADAKIARSPSVGAAVSGAALTRTSLDPIGLTGIDAQNSLSTAATLSADLAETDPTQAALLPGEIQSETSAAAAIGTHLEANAIDTDASQAVDTTGALAGVVGATGAATVDDAAETGITAGGNVSAAADAAASTVAGVVGHVGVGLDADAGADAGTNGNSAGASADAGAEGDAGGGLGGGIGGALGGVGGGLGGVL